MKKKDIIVGSVFLILILVIAAALIYASLGQRTDAGNSASYAPNSISEEKNEVITSNSVIQTASISSIEKEVIMESTPSIDEASINDEPLVEKTELVPLEKGDSKEKKDLEEKRNTTKKDSASKEIKSSKSVETINIINNGTAAGALSVSGANLVNQNGEAVQLKGLSTHGMAWYPDYINKNLFKEFKETWNANIIRLAMYTEEYGGYCSGGDRNNLLNLIENGVTYASELNMYVIIDWHILSDGNPNKNKNEAIAFFDYVSKKYKDNYHVIYEICNEPNGGTSWEDIKSYALEVIPVIRANAPDAIIIVGTPTWSQEVDKAAASPITEYSNIMYALHFYADTHKDALRKTMENAIKAGLPIFVTEYGTCDASGSGAINESEAGKWMALLDKYSISSCAWNISNKGETSAIIKSSCSKTYGLSESDLSDSGKWLFKMLTGNSVYDSSSVTFEEPAINNNQNNNETQNNQPQNNETASITISYQSGPVNISLVSNGSWESDGKSYTQYNVIVTNINDFDIGSWSGEVSFASNIELSQGWCANYSVEGNVLKLSNVDYNGYIKAGESTRDIGCIIIE